MIDFYTFTTPNGYKVSIMLEECGLPYETHVVDIRKDEQFAPEYLARNPNNKIPTIVDRDGPDKAPYTVFESGAILLYLAEKTGQFMPTDMTERYRVVQWLMFQMASVGPMLGQAHHFRQFAPEKVDYGIKRYTDEAARIYRVLDTRLGESTYLAGEAYTIADMATYPWLRSYEKQGQELDDYPNVQRWFEAITVRPAVQRGLHVPSVER